MMEWTMPLPSRSGGGAFAENLKMDRVLPYGMITVPTKGGTVSGAVYRTPCGRL